MANVRELSDKANEYFQTADEVFLIADQYFSTADEDILTVNQYFPAANKTSIGKSKGAVQAAQSNL